VKLVDFFSPEGSNFRPGDWNVIDDLTGMKVKASRVSKQWDGIRTTRPTKRHPQDFLRGTPEGIRTPWSRPEQEDVFVAHTNNMQHWLPNTAYTITTSVVVHNGVTYTANATHTSGNVFEADFNKWNRS
jgi:hypothetical protein